MPAIRPVLHDHRLVADVVTDAGGASGRLSIGCGFISGTWGLPPVSAVGRFPIRVVPSPDSHDGDGQYHGLDTA